jgi:hypothetical protein
MNSSLSGTFAGCVLAASAFGDQVIGDMSVTVVVRPVPSLTVRCGTRVARSGTAEATAAIRALGTRWISCACYVAGACRPAFPIRGLGPSTLNGWTVSTRQLRSPTP